VPSSLINCTNIKTTATTSELLLSSWYWCTATNLSIKDHLYKDNPNCMPPKSKAPPQNLPNLLIRNVPVLMLAKSIPPLQTSATDTIPSWYRQNPDCHSPGAGSTECSTAKSDCVLVSTELSWKVAERQGLQKNNLDN